MALSIVRPRAHSMGSATGTSQSLATGVNPWGKAGGVTPTGTPSERDGGIHESTVAGWGGSAHGSLHPEGRFALCVHGDIHVFTVTPANHAAEFMNPRSPDGVVPHAGCTSLVRFSRAPIPLPFCEVKMPELYRKRLKHNNLRGGGTLIEIMLMLTGKKLVFFKKSCRIGAPASLRLGPEDGSVSDSNMARSFQARYIAGACGYGVAGDGAERGGG